MTDNINVAFVETTKEILFEIVSKQNFTANSTEEYQQNICEAYRKIFKTIVEAYNEGHKE